METVQRDVEHIPLVDHLFVCTSRKSSNNSATELTVSINLLLTSTCLASLDAQFPVDKSKTAPSPSSG